MLLVVILLAVGLNGCNEQSSVKTQNNDDEIFIRQAKSIIHTLYPVSCYGLEYDSLKTTTYRLELNRYELSDNYDTVRDFILDALERIDYAYESYLKYSRLGCDSLSVKSGISSANNYFEIAQNLLAEK